MAHLTLTVSGGDAGHEPNGQYSDHYQMGIHVRRAGGSEFTTMDVTDFRAHFPVLTAIDQLNRCNVETGEPLYAADNGWFWAGGTKFNGDGPGDPPSSKKLAETLRIEMETARNLVMTVMAGKLDEETFRSLIQKELTPQWKVEALAVKSVIAELRRTYVPPAEIERAVAATSQMVHLAMSRVRIAA